MAINIQKFLPQKESNIVKYSQKNYNLNTKNINFNYKKTNLGLISGKVEDEDSQLLVIRDKFIKIENIISSLTLLRSKEEKRKKKETENANRKKVEDKLEKKEDGKEKETSIPVPGLGFLDRVKKFLFNVLFGFIAYRLIDHLPKFVKFFNDLKPAFKFLETFAGSLFNSIVNLVDIGYQFVDKTNKLVRDFGGEEAYKNFVAFEERLAGFINSALLFKMLLNKRGAGSAIEAGISSLLASGGVLTTAAAKKQLAKRIAESALGGGPARKIPKKSVGANKIISRGSITPYERRLLESPGTATGKLTSAEFKQQARLLGDKGTSTVPKKMIGDVDPGRKLFQKLSGQTEGVASKAATKAGAKVFGRVVPFVGPLVDFIISTVIFKEKPERAAAGAVGSLIGSFVGAGIAGAGTLGIGAGVGFFLGGLAGDMLGRALYDAFVSTTIKEYAGGGPVTRGGKIQPSANRKVNVRPPKRSLKIQPTQIKPGSDIGGEKKIEKIFPKSENSSQVNPYDFMKKSSKIMSSTDAFGPLFDLQAKALLGQKPSATDYRNAAEGINSWFNNTFSEGMTRGGVAFANGGAVDSSILTGGFDMTEMIQASLKRFVSPKVDNVIRELMKNLMLQDTGRGETPGQEPPVGGDVQGLQGQAKEYYDYLVSKGVSPNHAMGLILNIARESSFRPGVKIIDINGLPSGGLFQWNGGRFNNMVKAVPDWETNWKGQIDYALAEPQGAASGSNYLATQFRTPMEAAIWWMEKWERVADPARDTVKMQKILDGWIAQGMKQGQGPPLMLGTASGNLTAAQALATSMGLQLTSHVRPGDPGYHGSGRAMDFQTIGAPGNRGTPSQLAFAQQMVSRYGASLKQLIYTPLGYGISDGKRVGLDHWGDKTNSEHYHHVHVAFAKGGRVSKPTKAIIGEAGPEFIFDADTTKGLDKMMPNLLENLNAAKNKSELINVLRTYTGYENESSEVIEIEMPQPQVIVKEVPVYMPMSGGSFSNSDAFAGLAAL